MRLLIIEDEKSLCFEKRFEEHAFTVESAFDGEGLPLPGGKHEISIFLAHEKHECFSPN